MGRHWLLRRLLGLSERSRRLVSFLYFLVVNWLLLAPADSFDDIEDFLPNQDKLAHFGVFLLLSFLARWSLPTRGAAGRRPLGAFVALLAYAAAIEALQPLLGGAGREFDRLDLVGNLAGACCGWLLYGKAAGYHADRNSSA